MGDQLKKNLHILIRLAIVVSFIIYGTVAYYGNEERTGVSFGILLLISLFFALITVKELVEKGKAIALMAAVLVLAVLFYYGGNGYVLLLWYLSFELLALFKATLPFFFLPFIWLFMDVPKDVGLRIVLMTLLAVCYIEYEFGIAPYRKQVLEETAARQGLKRDLENTENTARAEMKKSMLKAENRILEDRAELSQTLHDKLGHNINGSIYQLEAGKVLMEKDPEKAKSMIQAVIDQLRTGMDEIRAILRKERPDKKQMALLQLYELCEDCNNKGVEAELLTEGELSTIPGDVWEVILDNCFEAVSNAMKYAQCKHINISITALNKMIRVNVKDDGKGCKNIVDGMGLSGMRQRIRSVGGTIDFESLRGFNINMLIPINNEQAG
jgi:signal transduction histidine kinase